MEDTKEQIKKKIDTVANESKGSEILEKGKEMLDTVGDNAKKGLEDLSNEALDKGKTKGAGPATRLSEALIILVLICLA